jgi:hypothetical protein
MNTLNMREKIKNHAIKYGRTEKEIINKILVDDMFAETFAIDPAKQNIYEKTAAKFISGLEFVENFQNLPATAKLFVKEGEITNNRNKTLKSIDFIWSHKELEFFATHKYTGNGTGTTQKHQYVEVRDNFLMNCKNIKNPNHFFLAILDGPYYEKFGLIEELNSSFSQKNVRVLRSIDVQSFMLEICSSIMKKAS